jgi:hypothetical protein
LYSAFDESIFEKCVHDILFYFYSFIF